MRLRDNVGLAKAGSDGRTVRQINPECRVTVIDDFITPDNVAGYMNAGFTYVIVDAIDSVRPKALRTVADIRFPLVTTGGAAGRSIDANRVADLAKTIRGSAGGKTARGESIILA